MKGLCLGKRTVCVWVCVCMYGKGVELLGLSGLL